MNFASGIASGTLGTLLLGLLGTVFLGRATASRSDVASAVLEDVERLLGEHLVPLIAALDRHGITLQRHGRALDRATGALGTHTAATTGMVSPALTHMPVPAPAPAPAAPVPSRQDVQATYAFPAQPAPSQES